MSFEVSMAYSLFFSNLKAKNMFFEFKSFFNNLFGNVVHVFFQKYVYIFNVFLYIFFYVFNIVIIKYLRI